MTLAVSAPSISLSTLDTDASRKFLQEIFAGESDGNACFMFLNPRRFGAATTRFLNLSDPEWLDRAIEYVDGYSETHDCYVAPAIFIRSDARRKEYVAGCRWIFLDRDDHDLGTHVPPPTITIETSPGRKQDFWRLDAPVDVPTVEDVNKRVAAASGCGNQAVDAVHIFRIPGTPNHGIKQQLRVRAASVVRFSSHHPEAVYSHDDFAHLPPPPPWNEERPDRQRFATHPLSDEEVVALLFKANNGGKMRRLFDGDTSEYGDDHSAADFALCAALAFYAGPEGHDQIARIFRTSALMRPKWDEARGEMTYGERTIARAVARQEKFYHPSHLHLVSGSGPTSGEHVSDGDLPPIRSLDDIGNGERLVDRFGNRIRYCPTLDGDGWLIFNGVYWESNCTGQLERWAKETARDMLLEAHRATEDRREAVSKHAARSQSGPKIREMIRQAQSDERVAITADKLDADPYLFNALNGTINLRTGELMLHSPTDLITMCAPVAFRPDATHELWGRFIERVVPDPETRTYLQRMAGASLLGKNPDEKVPLLIGPAATGKSTFLDAIASTVGAYAATAQRDTFLQRHRASGGATEYLAELAGKRIVIGIEIDKGAKLSEGLIKTLSGGDKVRARHLFKEAFEFRPSFIVWLAANDRPQVRADDDGMWRRLREIPFTAQIPESERDPKVKATLTDPAQCGAAILAWLIKGCLDYQCEGMIEPEAVRKATRAYQREMDAVEDFFADECTFAVGATVGKGELRRQYEEWSRENGYSPCNGREFADRLRKKGCGEGTKVDTEAGEKRRFKVWQGVTLTGDSPDPERGVAASTDARSGSAGNASNRSNRNLLSKEVNVQVSDLMQTAVTPVTAVTSRPPPVSRQPPPTFVRGLDITALVSAWRDRIGFDTPATLGIELRPLADEIDCYDSGARQTTGSRTAAVVHGITASLNKTIAGCRIERARDSVWVLKPAR